LFHRTTTPSGRIKRIKEALEMLLLVLLAILAIIAFSAGFVIKWMFIVAAVLALAWIISLFAGGLTRGGSRL
jgi:membrane protein YdbS with pleckstrin-like domain